MLEALWKRQVARCWAFLSDSSSWSLSFLKTGASIHTENQKRWFHCSCLQRMAGKRVPKTTVITQSATSALKNDLSRTGPGLDFHWETLLLPCPCRMPCSWAHASPSLHRPCRPCLMFCTRRCCCLEVCIRKALRLSKVSLKCWLLELAL